MYIYVFDVYDVYVSRLSGRTCWWFESCTTWMYDYISKWDNAMYTIELVSRIFLTAIWEAQAQKSKLALESCVQYILYILIYIYIYI